MSNPQPIAGSTVEGPANAVRGLAGLVGAVFLLVGVLGFIPGITTDYDSMEFTGHTSGAELLGLFQVSVLHNIVHLLFGVVGLALARTVLGARSTTSSSAVRPIWSCGSTAWSSTTAVTQTSSR